MVFETRQIWTSSQLPTLSMLGMKVLEMSRRSDTKPHELKPCNRQWTAWEPPWSRR